MTVLVVAEHDEGLLKRSSRSLVTAALQCGDDVHALVVGRHTEPVAVELACLAGVSRVLRVCHASDAGAPAEAMAAQVLSIAANYTHLLFAATLNGRNVAPRVAARLDVAQIGDVTRVVGPDTFVRPIYAGDALMTLQSADPIKVMTVRTTAFGEVGRGGAAKIDLLPAVVDDPRVQVMGIDRVRSSRPELVAADVVVAGGRALGGAESFMTVLAPLADKLGAALAASQAAVDAGYAPADWQVGQTGKVVVPDLYVACGISGAVQHLAGMKDAKVIVAINQDPEAPIFAVADYGLVADLFVAVPALVAQL